MPRGDHVEGGRMPVTRVQGKEGIKREAKGQNEAGEENARSGGRR